MQKWNYNIQLGILLLYALILYVGMKNRNIGNIFRYHDIPVFHFVSKIRYLKEYPLLHSKYIEIDVNVVCLA